MTATAAKRAVALSRFANLSLDGTVPAEPAGKIG